MKEHELRSKIENILFEFDQYGDADPKGFVDEIIDTIKANPLDLLVRQGEVQPVVACGQEEFTKIGQIISKSILGSDLANVPKDKIDEMINAAFSAYSEGREFASAYDYIIPNIKIKRSKPDA